ncbi:hypothetical protein HSR121_0345 [Halapricum desulfuricans]|uniref:Uncharacterized protein n=1 Tax=Halapricum desulfuricans TaxID=2841257 RepID=A0A897MWQ0_9EURY|nr:hypothetical protein HSR121_0345 [Halapricum desulfuricans]
MRRVARGGHALSGPTLQELNHWLVKGLATVTETPVVRAPWRAW